MFLTNNKRAISSFIEMVALTIQPGFTSSKSTKETLKTLEQYEKCVEVNSKDTKTA